MFQYKRLRLWLVKLSQTRLSYRPGDVAHAFSVLCRAFEPDIPESMVNSSPGPSTSGGQSLTSALPLGHFHGIARMTVLQYAQ